MFNVSLGPAFWLSQAAAAHMQQQGSEVIVHVACTAFEPGRTDCDACGRVTLAPPGKVHVNS
jgi:hypothetical protein